MSKEYSVLSNRSWWSCPVGWGCWMNEIWLAGIY